MNTERNTQRHSQSKDPQQALQPVVVFCHSYFLRFDPKQWTTAMPYPPLGTLYAAAYLRQHGIEVAFHDIQFASGPSEIESTLKRIRPAVFVIYDDGFNYLTKMCLTNMREAAFQMQQLAKAIGCTVVVSSSDATDHAEKYILNGADYVLIGEAEQTLLELTQKIIRNEFSSIGTIPGITYMQNGDLKNTGKRNVVRDLDLLPLPAWDLLDIRPYREMWMNHHGYFSLNLVTTRGCPYKCNWCAKPIYGNRYNSHSPENIVNMIAELQPKFDFSHIWFADDIFGLKPGWLAQFNELVKSKNLKFRYKIQSRADLLLQEDNIRHLAASGCDMVWMGAESGSQKILDAMDKGTTVDQIRQATHLLKKHGIKPAFFLQFGYPGETMDDIRKTIDLVNELLPYDIGISVSYPLPGTVFYERVKTELKNKTNWTDSNELALMFQNTYKSDFYKQLHRFVHKSYRKNQSLELLRSPIQHAKTRIGLKRMLALPYYYLSAHNEKRKLISIEPDAGLSF